MTVRIVYFEVALVLGSGLCQEFDSGQFLRRRLRIAVLPHYVFDIGGSMELLCSNVGID
jgi:hypothetical protein